MSGYTLARCVSGALVVLGAMVTYALTQDDLGLTKQGIALLGVANVGITALISALPRIQGDGIVRTDL